MGKEGVAHVIVSLASITSVVLSCQVVGHCTAPTSTFHYVRLLPTCLPTFCPPILPLSASRRCLSSLFPHPTCIPSHPLPPPHALPGSPQRRSCEKLGGCSYDVTGLRSPFAVQVLAGHHPSLILIDFFSLFLAPSSLPLGPFLLTSARTGVYPCLLICVGHRGRDTCWWYLPSLRHVFLALSALLCNSTTTRGAFITGKE
ncbi:hypothetical protein IWZ00DRAFT_237235 [Phyllosticta capitalensis]|uniref:Secreted protein n=1 Tax=Phyllosticta capitalensis TaxID=121624 RepID=A0ABR1YWS3_9PEZI